MRQGLMSAENVLLEPYYDYTLEVPSEYIGRAISDCNAMACSFTAPRDSGSGMILEGRGPAAELQCYTAELLSYTRGRGRLSCKFAGHFSCHNAEKIIEESGYEAERDCENIADSVFFSHGAGVNVKWDKAPEFMHVDSGIRLGEEGAELAHAPELIRGNISIDDKELEAVMRREFGEAKLPQTAAFTVDFGGRGKKRAVIKKDYLIIDGYNIIYAWDELKELARTSLEAARARLLELLVTYRAYKGSELCVVFDGYKLKGNPGSKGDEHGVHVVYTREGESADVYIEALMRDIGQNHAVRVASSDGMIQLCALRFGLVRVSARELEHEFDATFGEIEGILRSSGLKKLSLADIARLREKA